MNKTLYLCGPINGRTTEDATGWRELVKTNWPGQTLDPMRRDYRGRELEPGIAKEIVDGDIEDIQNSDAVLVFFDKPSVGTAMEVFYAKHNLGKIVVVVNASGLPLSPWMLHHSDFQTTNVNGALYWLTHNCPERTGSRITHVGGALPPNLDCIQIGETVEQYKARQKPTVIEGGVCERCGKPNMAHMGGSCWQI